MDGWMYPTTSLRAECDTRSIFKRSLNSDFRSPRQVALPRLKSCLSYF